METQYIPDRTPYLEFVSRIRSGRPLALATIVAAAGSTPQVPGASALFSDEGLIAGTVGGGYIEARAARLARNALNRQVSGLYEFSLADNLAEDADGVCGGTLSLLIDAFPDRHIGEFRKLDCAAKARRRGVLATWIKRSRGTDVRELRRVWIPEHRSRSRKIGLPGLADACRRALAERRPHLFRHVRDWLYLEPYFPPPRLVVAGAGHVGRAVAHLGKFLGFEVTVIDDRPEFADPRRFPDADKIIVGEFGRTLRKLAPGSDTFIVIVTRGHRRDEEALRACLGRAAGYIGMIGSRRKISLMRKKFLDRGWATAARWNRLYAPIGMPIGSTTVEEIAVSIAAELVSVRRSLGREAALRAPLRAAAVAFPSDISALPGRRENRRKYPDGRSSMVKKMGGRT
jgi:xanthine dehydrogenase accessory factor